MQPVKRAAELIRVGVISDTHALLRPEAVRLLTSCDQIIHARDIGAPEVIEVLRSIAPVTAIKGNIDLGLWAEDYPESKLVTLGNRTLYVLHNLKEIDLDATVSGIDVVISGHSHRPMIQTKNGVLYLNPGSAGPRRFKLPVSVATLVLADRAICPQIVEIAP